MSLMFPYLSPSLTTQAGEPTKQYRPTSDDGTDQSTRHLHYSTFLLHKFNTPRATTLLNILITTRCSKSRSKSRSKPLNLDPRHASY